MPISPLVSPSPGSSRAPVQRRCIVLIVLAQLVSPLFGADAESQKTLHKDGRTTTKLLVPASQPATGKTGKSIADEFLNTHRAEFGLSPEISPLEVHSIQESLLGTHYRYRQTLNGIPVLGAEVIVSVSQKNGQVYQSFNNSYPVENLPPLGKTLIGKEQALDMAWNHLRVHGKLSAKPEAQLVYLPEWGYFRLAYQTKICCEAPLGSWQHLIDAHSGEIISATDRNIYKNGRKPVSEGPNYQGPIRSRAEATSQWSSDFVAKSKPKPANKATVNGTALVFDPDPRTHLANDALIDTSPPSEFSAAYVTRTLRDISENNGVYSLDGPWVVVADIEEPTAAPSTTTDGNWTALRGDNAFNDAMTYFHIDQNQRYLQSLGFIGAKGIQQKQIQVDTNGARGFDNSYYNRDINALVFGHGGVDDNEDADVILHEYGHAIIEEIIPSWSGGDSGAIGEGFADYWGASYSYTTPNGPTFHPEWAFSWDGHSSDTWPGRRLDYTSLTYDSNVKYEAHMFIDGITDYSDQLWGTPLFQAFLTLVDQGVPRAEIDQIIIESFFGIGITTTMRDLATSTVNVATLLFPDGLHAEVFKQKFLDQNILTLEPENLIATPHEGTQVDLAWDASALASETLIAWNTQEVFGTPSGTPDAGTLLVGGGIVLYRGTSTTASHLTLPQGNYYYKAWSRLPDGSYSSGVSNSALVTTDDPLLEEDFEEEGSQPASWTQETVNGSTSWTYQNGGHRGNPAAARGGNHNAFLCALETNVDRTRLVTPTLDLENLTGSAELEFWHCMVNWSGSQDELRIFYKTSAGEAWTLLETYTSNVGTWTRRTIELPNPSSTYSLAFEGSARFGYGVCIDDVLIRGITNPPAFIITNTQAIVSENDGSSAGTITVTRTLDSSSSQSVTLSSNDPSELTLPTSVTIPAGRSSVSVTFDAIDDGTDDGPQTVTITASAPGFLPGDRTLQIEDDEESFLDWATSNGLTGPMAQPNATPFGDGVKNIEKYAFNMNGKAFDTTKLTPGSGLTGLPILHQENGDIPSFEFIRRSDRLVTYTLESSPNSLRNWSQVTLTPSDISNIDSLWERVSVGDTDTPAVGKLFYRLTLTLPAGP